MTSKREDREALIRAVQEVTWNASNYPPKIQPHVLGQDIVPLTMKIVDAVEAVFEQAHKEDVERAQAEALARGFSDGVNFAASRRADRIENEGAGA